MNPRNSITALGLFAAAVAVYAISLGHEFVWDDIQVIVENDLLGKPGAAWRAFGRDFGMEITGRPVGYYRPLVSLSFLLDHAAGGLSPFVYHLTNVLLHGLNTVLAFGLIARLAGRRVGVLAAAVFAVHPIHTESVSFVAGRSDLLCTFFLLAALRLLMGALATRSTAAVAWTAAFGAVYVAALLSKELAIALPAALVAYGLVHRYRFGNLVRLVGPSAVVAVAWLAFRLMFFPPAGLGPAAGAHGGGSIARAVHLVSVYAGQQILPIVPTLGAEVLATRAWVNLTALVLLCVLIVAARPRRHALDAAFWLALFLLPPLWVNLFKGIEPSDRFAYTPSLGACMLAGLVAARFWERERLVRLAMVAVLTLFAVTSFMYSRMWRDSESFWKATVAYHPECGRSYYNLGNTYFDKRNPGEAVEAYRKAVKLLKDEEILFRAHANLARILADSTGRGVDTDRLAIQSCRSALAIRPHRPSIRHLLGVLLARRGDHRTAVAEMETALAEHPGARQLLIDLAQEHLRTDPPDRERALELYRTALDRGVTRDGALESALDWRPDGN